MCDRAQHDVPAAIIAWLRGEYDDTGAILGALLLARELLFLPEKIVPDHQTKLGIECHGLFQQVVEFRGWITTVTRFEFRVEFVAEFMRVEGSTGIITLQALVLLNVDENPERPVVLGLVTAKLCVLAIWNMS